MKIHRMLEITTLLLNKGTVSAPSLAARFGVSVRTIYRDIEALSLSGVPVYTTPGAKGGVSILPEYAIGRAMLTERERADILFSLKALAVTQYPDADAALNKLGGLFRRDADDWLKVDFAPWGAKPNAADRFHVLKEAVLDCRVVEFQYIDVQNQRSFRRLEPLTMWFKFQAWYVSGYDLVREDMRTFRLTRIRSIRMTDVRFERDRFRPLPVKEPREPCDATPPPRCRIRFHKDALVRLYDDFDDQLLSELPDGKMLLTIDFLPDEWLYGYILSYGAQAEVLAPDFLREEMARRAAKICALYQNHDI